MIDIKCRPFFIKLERTLPSGEKIQLSYDKLDKKAQTQYHIAVCEVFNQMVVKDSLVEAKAVLDYIRGLKI